MFSTRLLLCSVLFLSACSYYKPVSITKQLSPGMSAAQVRNLMGDPSQTQFVGTAWVWKYTLAEWGTGNIPYYLAFRQDTQTLVAWAADEAAAQRNHANTMETLNQLNSMFPPKQKYDITIKHR